MTYTRQMIGNQGQGVPPKVPAFTQASPVQYRAQAASKTQPQARPQAQYRPQAHHSPQVYTRGFNQGTGFGGVNPYGNYPGLNGAQLPVQQSSFAPAPSAAPGGGGGGPLSGLASLFGGGSGGGSGSGFNLQKIQSFVERMGGIDGIIDTFGKMQRMVQTVQQMGPMVKLLLGSFGKGKGASNDDADDKPIRRRRRRKRAGSAKGRRQRSRR